MRTASLQAGPFANRLALVKIPRTCDSRMPALTPDVSPKSSPLPTSARPLSSLTTPRTCKLGFPAQFAEDSVRRPVLLDLRGKQGQAAAAARSAGGRLGS